MRECDIDKVIVPRASETHHFCTIHVTFSFIIYDFFYVIEFILLRSF